MDTDLLALRAHSTADLVKLAHQAGIEKATSLRRQDLVFELLCRRLSRGAQTRGSGVLEILPDGFGFLRTPESGYLPGADDIYVSPSQIRRFHLRTGDLVDGRVRAPKESERYIALIKLEQVNGYDPELQDRPLLFDNLTAEQPRQVFKLEHDPSEPTSRILDLLIPIGRGQRALVHSSARAGCLLLFRRIAKALQVNHPECHVILLAVHARPEDATALAAELSCEVVATTFDESANRHAQAAEIVNERARRLSESGHHVVVLVHSLTRLCRAYDELAGGTARLGTTGLEGGVLTRPRRLLADARRLREGGSLTVLASLASSQGARLDRAIAYAFRGTASTEIFLDHPLAVPGHVPGIDLLQSATSGTHLLLDQAAQQARERLRSQLGDDPVQATQAMLRLLGQHATNAELLDSRAQTGE